MGIKVSQIFLKYTLGLLTRKNRTNNELVRLSTVGSNRRCYSPEMVTNIQHILWFVMVQIGENNNNNVTNKQTNSLRATLRTFPCTSEKEPSRSQFPRLLRRILVSCPFPWQTNLQRKEEVNRECVIHFSSQCNLGFKPQLGTTSSSSEPSDYTYEVKPRYNKLNSSHVQNANEDNTGREKESLTLH